ncbi:alpha/beta hydrolase family protein [Deinococcus maricopensis]|uniref:Putative peptidase n=1 Tax=Deinococcus maricopensis (strain DSM 21211 / LMG 22137 / NRRL B-23946 / LB-34) TaxID=709986 RepID=E8U5H7_DEIML|nr:alpha/beta fold hydrolase [Deinococcus maricopensis]ADV66316.1 putative peptidase [Deinococcus maricopensis DSM 21211]
MRRVLLAALLLTVPALAQTESPLNADALRITSLRARAYPGSALTVERTLSRGGNYTRQVVSYRSDGLKIYALLTVPDGKPPKGGWPAIVFNHGYIPPEVYRTTERYVAYQDAFARAGFVTLKSDYRGHGASQGEARGGYYDPGYTIDVLNALGSLKRDPRVNRTRIGMWGHSMGGHLTLRAMVVDPSIKAGVIWAGVVAPYDLLMNGWTRGPGAEHIPTRLTSRRKLITEQYGTPGSNPTFWNAISPNSYLRDLGGPLQLHQGTADVEVPVTFHRALAQGLQAARKPYEAYGYPGDNHNLSRNLNLALNRSVAFFRKYL